MENEHHRRSIRIAGADYTEPGAYFLTICSANRRNIFGKIVSGRVILSPLGEIARRCWLQIPEHFGGTAVREFVVMPNHLHGIVMLGVGARYIVPSDRRARTPEGFQRPIRGSIPTIVRTYKAAVTREAGKSLWPVGQRLWQSNYFERVIRNGKEYAKAVRYIGENPARWEWDKENPACKSEPSASDSNG